MNEDHWQEPKARCFGMLLAGDAGEYFTPDGYPANDDTLLIIFNASTDQVPFRMPTVKNAVGWRCLLDTINPHQMAGALVLPASGDFTVESRSTVILALTLETP